jgi:hypothetical protein
MPKIEMVHNHEHWRKSHFSSLPLLYFSCVLLLAGYEDWLLLFMVCQRSDQVLVMECCLCDCVIEVSKSCWMEDNAFGC